MHKNISQVLKLRVDIPILCVMILSIAWYTFTAKTLIPVVFEYLTSLDCR